MVRHSDTVTAASSSAVYLDGKPTAIGWSSGSRDDEDSAAYTLPIQAQSLEQVSERQVAIADWHAQVFNLDRDAGGAHHRKTMVCTPTQSCELARLDLALINIQY